MSRTFMSTWCCAIDWDPIRNFSIVVFEQWINANRKIKFDEKEKDANFSNLQSKEWSNDSKYQSYYQENDVEYQVWQEQTFRALQKSI